MSAAAFVGRRADLLAFHGAFPADRELLTQQTLVPDSTGGLLCTGVQKLAQRFLLILLTKKGSMRYRPADGTTLMLEAAKGHWRTPAAVELAFNASRLDFMRQLRRMELPDDPADEIVDTVSLQGLTLLPDSVGLRIQLTTRAGSAYTFLTPIAVHIK